MCFFSFRSHIEKAGHTCELRDAAEFQSPAEVAHLLSRNPPFEGALAIHLFRAGRLLLGKHPSFYMICLPISTSSVICVCQHNSRPASMLLPVPQMSGPLSFMPNFYIRHPSTLWHYLWRNRHKWRCESWAEACGYGAGATESQVMYYFNPFNSKWLQTQYMNFASWFHTSHRLYGFTKNVFENMCCVFLTTVIICRELQTTESQFT